VAAHAAQKAAIHSYARCQVISLILRIRPIIMIRLGGLT